MVGKAQTSQFGDKCLRGVGVSPARVSEHQGHDREEVDVMEDEGDIPLTFDKVVSAEPKALVIGACHFDLRANHPTRQR